MTRAEILDCLTDRPCDSCKFHESGRCERWDCVFEEKPDDAEDCEDKRMTREEAIRALRYERKTALHENKSAFDMAIKSLSAEPCEDTINRAELLKAIDTWDKFGVDDTNSLFRLDNLSLPHYVPYIHYDDVIKCIKGMSSVTPKQKMCFDGMTNGEVIDLIFPGADIYHNRDFTLREMIFPDEWWDAPYKAESEDKE